MAVGAVMMITDPGRARSADARDGGCEETRQERLFERRREPLYRRAIRPKTSRRPLSWFARRRGTCAAQCRWSSREERIFRQLARLVELQARPRLRHVGHHA